MDAARNGGGEYDLQSWINGQPPECASSRLVHDQSTDASADIMGGAAPVASGAPDTMGELLVQRPQDAPGNCKTALQVVRVTSRNMALPEALRASFPERCATPAGTRRIAPGRVADGKSGRWLLRMSRWPGGVGPGCFEPNKNEVRASPL